MIVKDAAMPLPVKVSDKWAINKSDNLTDLKDLWRLHEGDANLIVANSAQSGSIRRSVRTARSPHRKRRFDRAREKMLLSLPGAFASSSGVRFGSVHDGFTGGTRPRPQPKIKPNQRADIVRMVNSGETSTAEAARLFGLHRSSVSRWIWQANSEKAIAVG
jgi:hypothetical protein